MPASPLPSAPSRPTKRQGAGITVAELSRLTGVSVRNIRAYQTSGLLAPPSLQGRLGLYSPQHKSRLELIRDMRQMGFGLEAIGDLLKRLPERAGAEYSLVAQMFSNGFFRVEKPLRKPLAELTAHWSETISPEQLQRLLTSGLYEPAPQDTAGTATGAGDRPIDVLSPSLWRIGQQMAEMGIPLTTVLDLQDHLIAHTRAIAQAYVDQFVLAMVREIMSAKQPDKVSAEVSPEAAPAATLRAMLNLFERLRPLAIGSVSAAFPVLLQQEFDRGIQDKLQAHLDRKAGESPV